MDAEPHVITSLTVTTLGAATDDPRSTRNNGPDVAPAAGGDQGPHHGPAQAYLDLATAVVAAASWPALRRACEPLVRELLGATRATLALTEAYLAPHLDLTTAPPLGPLLRVPLEAGGRTLGVLEVTAADAGRLTGARPTAERVAALVAARLADLRRHADGGPDGDTDSGGGHDGGPDGDDGGTATDDGDTRAADAADGDGRQAPQTLAEALDDLRAPVAVTATTDGAHVWRNRAYLIDPPPPVHGPDVVVAVGDLAVAAWGGPDTTDGLRTAIDEALTSSDAVAVLRAVHDAAGAVTEFDVAWSNRADPELGGASLRTSVRAATRRIGGADLFAQLTEVLRTQEPAALTGLDVIPAGAASPPSPLVHGLDVHLAPLGDAVVCAWHATTDPAVALRSLEDREQLFRTALDATLDPVTIVVPVHADGRLTDFELVWCNRAHLAGSGPRPGESMRDRAHTMPSVDIVEAHRRVHETGEPMVLDDVLVQVTDQAGDVVEEFVDVGIARFGAGLLTSYRPATERIRAQRDLQESERLFRSVFDEAPRGTLLFSLDETCLGRCLRVNPAFLDLCGYSEQEVLDGGWTLVVPPGEVERTHELFAEMAAGSVHRRHREGHVRTASGALVDVQADYSVVTRSGRPGYCVVHVEDITERRRAESEISWLAMHDALTGLPNRHLFLHHVRHALGRLERRPGSLAVLSVVVRDDLDPDEAELLFCEVARRLADAVRRSDTPSRLGGGDFVVLLPEAGGPDGVRRLARRVAEVLADDVALADRDVPLHARIGTALTADAAADPVQLVRNARLDAGQPHQQTHQQLSQVVQPRQRNV